MEGSGGVNAYLKDGQASAMINCRVNSLEFGGKPVPGENNPKVTDSTTLVNDEFPF